MKVAEQAKAAAQEFPGQVTAGTARLITEPYFLYQGNHQLNCDAVIDFHASLNHFSYCIRRTPTDLIQHVRKILLCCRYQASGPLYCALIDLFIALGPKGMPLKKRMLRVGKPILSAEHYAELAGMFVVAVNPDPEKVPDECLLKARCTQIDLAPVQQAEIADQQNIEELVQAYIEHCQLDEAMETLETYLEANPGHEALHALLIDIYKARGDTDRIDRFFNRLFDAGTR